MISLKNTLEAIGTKISAINSSLGNVPHRTLLWTNPNPSSSFGGQTISLDLEDYDEVYITFNEGEVTRQINGKALEVCRFAGLDSGSKTQHRFRFITPNASGVTFSNGCQKTIDATTYSNDNTNLIPQKIYGIKWGGGIA